jgi:hypothetical protein
MSYGGSATVSVPAGMPKVTSGSAGPASAKKRTSSKPATTDKHDCGCGGHDPNKCECKPHDHAAANGNPDFAHMTAAEKLAYNKAQRDRIFG